MFNRVAGLALLCGSGFLFSLAAAPAVASPEADVDVTGLLASDTSEASQNQILLTAGSVAESTAEPRLSDAQRIARLQRTLDADQKHLAELKGDLAALEKEYQQADAEFKLLDSRLDAQKRSSNKTLVEPGPATGELTAKWDLAKQRFELAIRERKALQTLIATLETKMAGDRRALDGLLKPADPVADSADPSSGAATVADSLDVPAIKPPAVDVPAASPSVDSQMITVMAASMLPTLSPLGTPALPAEPSLNSLAPVLPSEAKNEALSKATKEAKKKNVVAHQAQVAAQSATERAENLDRNIVLERTLLDTAQERVANVESTLTNLEAEFHKKLLAGPVLPTFPRCGSN